MCCVTPGKVTTKCLNRVSLQYPVLFVMVMLTFGVQTRRRRLTRLPGRRSPGRGGAAPPGRGCCRGRRPPGEAVTALCIFRRL